MLVYVNVYCVYVFLQRLEAGISYLKVQLTELWAAQSEAGNQTDPLEELQMFLTAEPSFSLIGFPVLTVCLVRKMLVIEYWIVGEL